MGKKVVPSVALASDSLPRQADQGRPATEIQKYWQSSTGWSATKTDRTWLCLDVPLWNSSSSRRQPDRNPPTLVGTEPVKGASQVSPPTN